MKRRTFLVCTAALFCSAFLAVGCTQKTSQPVLQQIEYSNLADSDTQDLLSKLLQDAADPGPLPIQCGCHPAVRAEALFRMAHSPPVTSLSPHSYGSRVVRYSLRLPVRTFNARLTSNAISMRSISVLVA